jgi:hypothetical protein
MPAFSFVMLNVVKNLVGRIEGGTFIVEINLNPKSDALRTRRISLRSI